jgi:hypothetical protein
VPIFSGFPWAGGAKCALSAQKEHDLQEAKWNLWHEVKAEIIKFSR